MVIHRSRTKAVDTALARMNNAGPDSYLEALRNCTQTQVRSAMREACES